jgi:hypothetical protein
VFLFRGGECRSGGAPCDAVRPSLGRGPDATRFAKLFSRAGRFCVSARNRVFSQCAPERLGARIVRHHDDESLSSCRKAFSGAGKALSSRRKALSGHGWAPQRLRTTRAFLRIALRLARTASSVVDGALYHRGGAIHRRRTALSGVERALHRRRPSLSGVERALPPRRTAPVREGQRLP